ncbi:peptide-methionine (R)-S-oxide reductase MsrB [Candidatus Saccharibacteria bacterium]|jgi:peptide-methionine (R)-S-oxide reductase|nr:peptide-methionine (R)-S-oxide reductase MsrB [Candidatus Saccharibacteria bacterium]
MNQINKSLTDKQKKVLFEKATEAPFSGSLLNKKDDGTFVCANCDQALFDSSSKFDSNCGWPTFDQAIDGSVTYSKDTSHFMIRTEVTCSNCGGHLGHVFDDGPKETTGQRFCLNSLSLDFKDKK